MHARFWIVTCGIAGSTSKISKKAQQQTAFPLPACFDRYSTKPTSPTASPDPFSDFPKIIYLSSGLLSVSGTIQ